MSFFTANKITPKRSKPVSRSAGAKMWRRLRPKLGGYVICSASMVITISGAIMICGTSFIPGLIAGAVLLIGGVMLICIC